MAHRQSTLYTCVFTIVLMLLLVTYCSGRRRKSSLPKKGGPDTNTYPRPDPEAEKHWTGRLCGTADRRCRFMPPMYQRKESVPGLCIGVSIDGEIVWNEGLGVADIELQSPCTDQTLMRIASISKPISMAIFAKLSESGHLDLDAPVRKYLPEFPEKRWDGNVVEITGRMLAEHYSGIRHYHADRDREPDLIRETFGSSRESLAIFKDDDLVSEPGTKFLYSTYGWTLLAAAAETATGRTFQQLLVEFVESANMSNTCLDENLPIIRHRARFYRKNDRGEIQNAAEFSSSYMWSAGGLLSTVGDLLRFASLMLSSYQLNELSDDKNNRKSPYLSASSMQNLWTPTANSALTTWSESGERGSYGMGWGIFGSESAEIGAGPHHQPESTEKRPLAFLHIGRAVGASSILYIEPRPMAQNANVQFSATPNNDGSHFVPACGICIAVLANLGRLSMVDLARDISHAFSS